MWMHAGNTRACTSARSAAGGSGFGVMSSALQNWGQRSWKESGHSEANTPFSDLSSLVSPLWLQREEREADGGR